MPSLFDPEVRTAVLGRIACLRPDRKPIWGRFTAPEMVCHVSCGLRQGLGELESGPPSGPLARFPVNWLMIHVVPWPKGKAQSRVFGRMSGQSWGVLQHKHLDHHLRQFGI